MTRKQKRRNAKRRRHGRMAIGTASAIGVAGAIAAPAQGADFTVYTLTDAGAGSLREAITSANLTPAVEDRVLFQSGLTGEIELVAGLPQIQSPVEIIGPGKGNLAIDGQGSFRIFDVDYDASISGLTLKGGQTTNCYPCAPGQYNGGAALTMNPNTEVNLDGIAFSGNEAPGGKGGAIYAAPGTDLAIRDSTFSGNKSDGEGGALYAKAVLSPASSVSISGSTFTDNSAGYAPLLNASGGAVASKGYDGSVDMDISASTFTGNKGGEGGGLFAATKGKVTVAGSTFSGNHSAYLGGGAMLRGQFSVTGSVFTANESE